MLRFSYLNLKKSLLSKFPFDYVIPKLLPSEGFQFANSRTKRFLGLKMLFIYNSY